MRHEFDPFLAAWDDSLLNRRGRLIDQFEQNTVAMNNHNHYGPRLD